MGNRCRRLLVLTLAIIVFSPMPFVWATLDFQNPHATVVLKATNAQLRIGNNQQVFGCSNRSIVEDFGHEVSSAWREAYSNGAVISQAGGTKVPQTDLVTANSNVVVSLNVLLRTNSNTTLYMLRVNSNAQLYGDRVNSNALVSALVTLTPLVRTYSNAYAYGIKNNSNVVNLLYSVPTTDSIDGTQMMRYHTAHHVFHTGASTVRGWVRFNDGFTVMPQASVLMDTLVTVSGVIDLRDTGMLALNNDLYLAHNVTLTSGGYIEGESSMTPGGQANTIFMGGDLTLASDNYAKVLHITGDWANGNNSGDLVIDGCGHTLNIGSQAQIFVDQNVTLTLRNMTIKTSPASALKPAIQLASLGSKLALDNVMFDLGADFNFEQGQLFIHDEVAVTGTSAFIYTSPKPSYITSGATWSFEQGITFSIAPATYTDQPFAAGAATSNNFIVLADQSAALSLSGCSLKTTFTGARLSKGMVLFDNKVSIDTQAGNEITGLGTGVGLKDYTVTASCVAFSPDGRYIAVGALDSNANLYIYAFNGTTALGSPVASMGMGGSANAVPAMAWSPDGKFLAMGGDSAVGLRIVRFNGTSTLTSINTPAFGILVNSVAWSPDGRYLAVGGNNGTTPLIIYRFNGTSLTQVTTLNPNGNTIQVNSVAWNPDGKSLVLTARFASVNRTGLYVYSFNGSTLAAAGSSGGDGVGCSVSWSPDGRFIVWGWSNSGTIGIFQVYRFTGSGFAWVATVNFLGTQVNAVTWSLDGRFIMAGSVSSGVGKYSMYRFDTANLTTLVGSTTFGTVATTVAWSPDSKYVLIGGTNGTTDLMVFPVTRTATATNTQGFTNGLVFGDSAKGAAYDTDVQAFGGASVAIKGMVLDDSV